VVSDFLGKLWSGWGCLFVFLAAGPATACEPDAAAKVMAAYREGCAFLERGEPSNAAARFEAMTRLEPANAEAHRMLGVAYWRIGQSDKAKVAWEQVQRLDAGGPLGVMARLLVMRAGLARATGGLTERDPLLDPSDFELCYRPRLAELPRPDDAAERQTFEVLLAELTRASADVAHVPREWTAVTEELDRIGGGSDAVNVRLAHETLDRLRERARTWGRAALAVAQRYLTTGNREGAAAVVRFLEEIPFFRRAEADAIRSLPEFKALTAILNAAKAPTGASLGGKSERSTGDCRPPAPGGGKNDG